MCYNSEQKYQQSSNQSSSHSFPVLPTWFVYINAPRSKLSFLPLTNRDSAQKTMSYFKITLIRSAIGLPRKTHGVLSALGLRKRMRTVFHPVSPQIAGHIMKVKELVAVSEVESALTKAELRDSRRPEPGYYIEKQSSPLLEEEGL